MDFATDRAIWKAAGGDKVIFGTNLSYWGFSCPDTPSQTFELTVYRNGSSTKATISDGLARMFVWFDLVFWQSYVDAGVNVHPNTAQTTCFHLRLRQLVEEEIQTATTPPSNVLRFWATRTVHSRTHGNHDAAILEANNQYTHLPAIAQWNSIICKRLPYITPMVELWLQESEAVTGHLDALSFLVQKLGFEQALQVLPFRPGRRMPKVQLLAHKRGLTATAMTAVSRRARVQIWKGLEGLTNMVDAYRGKEVPLTVESVEWTNGLVTCLPWTSGDSGEIWDKQLVERMAAAPDARDPSLPLGHQCLLLEPPQEHEPVHVYDDRVREALGNGHCVLLAGQNLEGPDSLSLEELTAWRGPQSQNLECMDAKKRIKAWSRADDKPKIHTNVTLERFVNKRTPDECLNCLDLPDMGSNLPQPSIISRLSDNITALGITTRTSMTFIRTTNKKMSRWALLTHAGFVTYPHKDADGLCTWIYAHQGVKIWGVLKPTCDADHCSKEDLFRAHDKMISPPGNWTWDENSSMYTTFLAAGDLLIMPPGTWHVVYTPTPSYVTGGHFYTLESLHLTEFSRAYDHRPEGRFATNAEHDTLRILSRMAIALPVFQASRPLYKKPMIALAHMITKPYNYVPDIPGKSAAVKDLPDIIEKEERHDLEKAQKIMKKVLADLRRDDVNGGNLSYGAQWDLCGHDTIDKIML